MLKLRALKVPEDMRRGVHFVIRKLFFFLLLLLGLRYSVVKYLVPAQLRERLDLVQPPLR